MLDEAKKVMDEAVPLGSMLDVHFYARTLLNQNQPKEAFSVFKANYDKRPEEFTTNVGMARAYSSLADYKKALPYLKKALPKSPDEMNKTRIQEMMTKLEKGEDINK